MMDVRQDAITGLHCPRYIHTMCDCLTAPFLLFGWMLGSRDERWFGCGPCPTSALAGLLLLLLLGFDCVLLFLCLGCGSLCFAVFRTACLTRPSSDGAHHYQ